MLTKTTFTWVSVPNRPQWLTGPELPTFIREELEAPINTITVPINIRLRASTEAASAAFVALAEQLRDERRNQ